MKVPHFYTRLLLLSLIFSLYTCKHQEKQVAAVARTTSKKPPVAGKPGPSKSPVAQPATNDLQQKLDVSEKQIKESKLYTFIDDWYGTPYKYAGCQKTGVDCSCFANLLYDKVYGKKIGRSSNDMFKECDEITLDQAKSGDLLFFKIGGNTITHVGVFLKNKLFVHSSTSKGVIINSLDEAYYKKYFFCAGKMKSV
ncbi:glycoside hydrolase [Sphingobacteriaceae bacterium]|nr:glycoside hydrolase [Sphingobacteriaceae bacterium]